jgi:hypothetical protein
MIATRIKRISMTKEKPLISAAILLRGEKLDPALVSKMVGIQPSQSQKKGGFKPGSTKFIAKFGMWALKVKSETRPLLELIDELFKQIGDPPTPLNTIEGVEDARLDIFFALEEAGTKETIEFVLAANHIKSLSEFGLSLSVTMS